MPDPASPPAGTIPCVEIAADACDIPLIEEIAAAGGLTTSSWTAEETGKGIVRVYCADADAARTAAAALERDLPTWRESLAGATPVVSLATLAEEDWTETWKRFFHTFRASDRLVVKPRWEAFDPEPGDIVLEIDPGMSFGTGYHGTTRACLEFLDRLARTADQPPSFLDAGCGSGILSLAASRLGYAPVTAFDIDPIAVRCARENLAEAGVEGVTVTCADLAAFAPGRRFDVVAANILAPVLVENAEVLDRLVAAQGGRILLAGILTTQYDAVAERFVSLGYAEVERKTLAEWTSGWFKRTAGGADRP